jgi:hypothetical protein
MHIQCIWINYVFNVVHVAMHIDQPMFFRWKSIKLYQTVPKKTRNIYTLKYMCAWLSQLQKYEENCLEYVCLNIYTAVKPI